MMPHEWPWMDLEKSKNIIKCLSLWGREGSCPQMGVFCLSFSCPLPAPPQTPRPAILDAFSPSLIGTWKQEHSLWGSSGTGIGSCQGQRLKFSLCVQLPDSCLLLPMSFLPHAMASWVRLRGEAVAPVLTTWIGLHFPFQERFKIINSRKADLGNSYDGYIREVSIGRREQGGDILGLWEWKYGETGGKW